MSALTPEGLRANPELATLTLLAAQLQLVEVVLTSVHHPDARGALADQARSMTRVSRILADQLNAYAAMVQMDGDERTRRFT